PERSSVFAYGTYQDVPRSRRATSQKWATSRTDHAWSSAAVLTPTWRMSRATRVSVRWWGDGRQRISSGDMAAFNRRRGPGATVWPDRRGRPVPRAGWA